MAARAASTAAEVLAVSGAAAWVARAVAWEEPRVAAAKVVAVMAAVGTEEAMGWAGSAAAVAKAAAAKVAAATARAAWGRAAAVAARPVGSRAAAAVAEAAAAGTAGRADKSRGKPRCRRRSCD